MQALGRASASEASILRLCEHVFVRWDNLTIENETGARLPGFREPAVVRTFDAPEALGINFYEVQARSAINKVPDRSQMPFRYTINPYRGCTHACAYCLGGATPILMAEGRTKPLSDVSAGDRVYGTIRRGQYRRYAITQVLDHWTTRKHAYRVTLEDGTELIASGDHRFLSDRGWKHVIGTEWRGPLRRPHLTLNNRLIGIGQLARSPAESDEYRRGYLTGMIRGDGHVGTYSYQRAGRTVDDYHQFRLALTDREALARSQSYLAAEAIDTDEFVFSRTTAGAPAMMAIRTQARGRVQGVRDVIRWPDSPSDDWCAGFLAGIFDAEGSHGGAVIRIANTDPLILDWTEHCLNRFGFKSVVERRDRANGLAYIRLTGGLPERIRFLLRTDPAITRKRSIEGLAVKCKASLRVAAIEPIGEQDLFDITTGTGDFVANGVVSHNCFARPTHSYLDFNPREDFERQIVVKVNAPELVRKELARPSWKGDHVALGTNTDPYQWVESRYRVTEGIWEAMRDYANPCSVLTKSPLLLRDLGLFRELVERTEFVANLSVPTLDEKAWRATEPHTPHPRKRLEAVAELVRAGIPTGVLVAPLMPGINDAPEQVEPILELAGEAGARSIGGVALHLRGEVRDVWFDWLRQYRPDLLPRYEELYERGAYMAKGERARLSSLVKPRGGGARGSRDVGRNRAARASPQATDEPNEPAVDPPRQSSLF
jgi:DNA repair photolyase